VRFVVIQHIPPKKKMSYIRYDVKSLAMTSYYKI
jgi:hypothetical protein